MPHKLFFRVILLLTILSIDLSSSTEEGIYHFLFTNVSISTEMRFCKSLFITRYLRYFLTLNIFRNRTQLNNQLWRFYSLTQGFTYWVSNITIWFVYTLTDNSSAFLLVECKSEDPNNEILVTWNLIEPPCYLMVSFSGCS